MLCKDGYELNGSKLCTPSNCSSVTNNNCTNCASGYYLENNLCNQIPANCLISDFNHTTGVCVSCINTFYEVLNGECWPKNC